MKKLIFILSFIFSFTLLCSQVENNKPGCEKTYYYGGTEICLPEFIDKKECYSHPIIKETVSYLLGDNGMCIMGFYIPEKTYEKFYYIDAIPFNGVFVVYAQENMKYVTGDEEQLEKVSTMIKNSFPESHIDVNNFIADKTIARYDKPVLLDYYSPNSKARSFMLMSYLSDGINDYINTSIMNMIMIKEKLITLVYYDIYENEESIKKIKSKNDYVVLRFLDENN